MTKLDKQYTPGGYQKWILDIKKATKSLQTEEPFAKRQTKWKKWVTTFNKDNNYSEIQSLLSRQKVMAPDHMARLLICLLSFGYKPYTPFSWIQPGLYEQGHNPALLRLVKATSLQGMNMVMQKFAASILSINMQTLSALEPVYIAKHILKVKPLETVNDIAKEKDERLEYYGKLAITLIEILPNDCHQKEALFSSWRDNFLSLEGLAANTLFKDLINSNVPLTTKEQACRIADGYIRNTRRLKASESIMSNEEVKDLLALRQDAFENYVQALQMLEFNTSIAFEKQDAVENVANRKLLRKFTTQAYETFHRSLEESDVSPYSLRWLLDNAREVRDASSMRLRCLKRICFEDNTFNKLNCLDSSSMQYNVKSLIDSLGNDEVELRIRLRQEMRNYEDAWDSGFDEAMVHRQKHEEASLALES